MIINKLFFQIHCGNNYYICYDRYLDAVNKASSTDPTKVNKRYSAFIRSISVTIVGLENLKNCSVKGRKCNRKKGAVAKPAIPSDKLKAIYGKFLFTSFL